MCAEPPFTIAFTRSFQRPVRAKNGPLWRLGPDGSSAIAAIRYPYSHERLIERNQSLLDRRRRKSAFDVDGCELATRCGRVASQLAIVGLEGTWDTRARVAPDRLGRKTNPAHEGFAHVLAVAKAGLSGDDLKRMPALFDHQPRCLQP